MEKCRRNRSSLTPARFLISLFFLTHIYLFSAEIDIELSAWEIIKNESLYVTITVQNERPKDVDVSIAYVPESFTLIQEKKEQKIIQRKPLLSDSRVDATVQLFQWQAHTSGSFEIGPFYVRIKELELTFPPVYITVRENFIKTPALLSWHVPDQFYEVGKTIRLQLYGQFVGQFLSLRCSIPENSLFEQIQNKEQILKDNSNIYAKELTLIAEYDWTPLVSGIVVTPHVLLEFLNESGESNRISAEEKNIHVHESKMQKETQSSSYLAHLLTEEQIKTTQNKKNQNSGFPLQDLVHLRRVEYTSFFPSKVRKQRIALEKELNLFDTPSVPSGVWKKNALIFVIVFWVLALIFHFFALKRNWSKSFVHICIVIALLFSIITVYVYIQDANPQALVDTCDILQIPEFDSSVIEHVQAGTIVWIHKKTGLWYFIKTKEGIKGWLPSNVVYIYTGF